MKLLGRGNQITQLSKRKSGRKLNKRFKIFISLNEKTRNYCIILLTHKDEYLKTIDTEEKTLNEFNSEFILHLLMLQETEFEKYKNIEFKQSDLDGIIKHYNKTNKYLFDILGDFKLFVLPHNLSTKQKRSFENVKRIYIFKSEVFSKKPIGMLQWELVDNKYKWYLIYDRPLSISNLQLFANYMKKLKNLNDFMFNENSDNTISLKYRPIGIKV